jgi:hypothetical protein
MCLCGAGFADSLRAAEGNWARYEVVAGPIGLPHVTEVILSFPVAEDVGAKPAIWFQLEVWAGEERLYAVAALVSSLDFIYPGAREVVTHRYLLFPGAERGLEYVARETGSGFVPRMAFYRNLVPHAAEFADGTYLGRTLRRVERGIGAKLLPLADALRLELETEVVIARSRHLKEDDGVRLYPPGPPGTRISRPSRHQDLQTLPIHTAMCR